MAVAMPEPARMGLVEDTDENPPQAEAAARLDDVRENLLFWTAKPRPYIIEKVLFFVGDRRGHLWTAW